MSLVKENLKGAIEGILNTNATSARQFVTRLAGAYDSYAAEAMDPSMDNPMTLPGASRFNLLIRTMDILQKSKKMTNEQARKTLAGALGKCLVSYWSGLTFNLATPPPGWVSETTAIVTSPGSAGVIKLNGLSRSYTDRATVAGIWADDMDAFTKTVQVTINGLIPSGSGTAPAPPITGPLQ